MDHREERQMLDRLTTAVLRLLANEKGASSMEYALVAALISVAAIAAFQTLADSLNSIFGLINSDFSSAMPGS